VSIAIRVWHAADLVGTGVASFGHFRAFITRTSIPGSSTSPHRQGELPINRALPINIISALIREMILQLKTGKLDAGYFRGKFDVEIFQNSGKDLIRW